MGVHETKMFRSGEDMAVLLPRDMAFAPDTRLTIERNGDVVTIRPAVDKTEAMAKWREMLADLAALPRPGEIEPYEPFEFPDRPGL